MLTRKTAKTITLTLAAALGLSISLPATNSEAITVDQIFRKVGYKYPSVSSKPQASGKTQKSPVKESKPTTNQNNSTPSSNQKSSNGQEQNTDLGDRIIKTGEKYLGTPYKFGSSSKTTATFDCSSFVQRVFKENGIELPRSSRAQSKVGQTVSTSQLKKGDLLFFTRKSTAPQVGHVAIYAGNGKILHTYGPGGVRYDDFNKKWLQDSFVVAKRVLK